MDTIELDELSLFDDMDVLGRERSPSAALFQGDERHPEVLFAYASTPSCGFLGQDDGGFSVILNQDGQLTYQTYRLEFIEKTRAETQVSKDAVAEIQALLVDQQPEIEALDSRLDGGVRDGDMDYFIFNGKRILVFTIWDGCSLREKDLRENIQALSLSQDRFSATMRQECRILLILAWIRGILQKEGIQLGLKGVAFPKK